MSDPNQLMRLPQQNFQLQQPNGHDRQFQQLMQMVAGLMNQPKFWEQFPIIGNWLYNRRVEQQNRQLADQRQAEMNEIQFQLQMADLHYQLGCVLQQTQLNPILAQIELQKAIVNFQYFLLEDKVRTAEAENQLQLTNYATNAGTTPQTQQRMRTMKEEVEEDMIDSVLLQLSAKDAAEKAFTEKKAVIMQKPIDAHKKLEEIKELRKICDDFVNNYKQGGKKI